MAQTFGGDQPAPDLSPVLARRRLARELLRLRSDSGLVQQAVAAAIGKTVSAVSRYESGKVAPLDPVLQLLLRTYGVTDDHDAAHLTTVGDQARKPSPYARYVDDVPSDLVEAFELTSVASRIRVFRSVVPWLLQVPDYTRSALSWMADTEAGRRDVDAQTLLKPRVGLVAELQEDLRHRREPPTCEFVLGVEAVEKLRGWPPVVASAQLDRLVDIAHADNIVLRLLPYDSPQPVGYGPVSGSELNEVLLEFGDPADSVGYSDASVGHAFWSEYPCLEEDPERLRALGERFDRVCEAALPAEQSLAQLEAARDEIRPPARRPRAPASAPSGTSTGRRSAPRPPPAAASRGRRR